jgi:hypothetical protein
MKHDIRVSKQSSNTRFSVIEELRPRTAIVSTYKRAGGTVHKLDTFSVFYFEFDTILLNEFLEFILKNS